MTAQQHSARNNCLKYPSLFTLHSLTSDGRATFFSMFHNINSPSIAHHGTHLIGDENELCNLTLSIIITVEGGQ